MANKVKFGLKNTHYAIVTEEYSEETGVWTSSYGPVKAWPGSVNMSLSAEGGDEPFYADDITYFMTSSNLGYSGDFESALVPDDVHEDVFGEVRDENQLLVESSTQTKKYIALLFEVNGDSKANRYCFYRCMLTRPNVEGSTKTDTTEPKTESVSINALPRIDADHIVKCVADSKTTTQVYNDFFKSVPVPSFA